MSVSILAGLLWWKSNPSNIQDQVRASSAEEFLHSLALDNTLRLSISTCGELLSRMMLWTGGTSLLLLNLLGLLPSIQCDLRIPPGTPNANQGKVLGNVPALIILLRPYSRGPTNGARPPDDLRHHLLLDGWPEALDGHIRPHSPHRPLQCACCPGPWARPRGDPDGCEAGNDLGLCHHARVPACRRLLHTAHPRIHGVAEVRFFQPLLLQAARRGPVLSGRVLSVWNQGSLQGP